MARTKQKARRGKPSRPLANPAGKSSSESEELVSPDIKKRARLSGPGVVDVPPAAELAHESKEVVARPCHRETFDESDASLLIAEVNKSVYARRMVEYDPRGSTYPKIMSSLHRKGVNLRLLEQEFCVVAESCSTAIVLYHDATPPVNPKRETFDAKDAALFIAELNSSMRARYRLLTDPGTRAYEALESTRYTDLFGNLHLNVHKLHYLSLELSVLLHAAMCAARVLKYDI